MKSKALKEIELSEPYFKLLGQKNIKKNLKRLLIIQAPPEFYSVLTQATRHLLNGTFCVENPQYCTKFENSLYLIALPETRKRDKQKILESEPAEFISEIFTALKKAL